MKFLLQASIALAMACNSLAAMAAGANLPSGTIRQGSLANQKLIQDATLAVVADVARQGCAKPQRYLPYVMKEPSGAVGSRAWMEKWMVEGCGKRYPVVLMFAEDGANAANYTIVKQ